MTAAASFPSPPVPYFGGKQRIAKGLIALMLEHSHYIEPFSGGLSVLFAKPPKLFETVNDLDGNVQTFWRTLRDRPEELARVCALTPHSRVEHSDALDLDGAVDELERARRVWVRLTQGRGGRLRPVGWRHHLDPNGSTVSVAGYLRGYVKRIEVGAARLANVSLECGPAVELIARYGRFPENPLYCDPPYLSSTRGSASSYSHEMRSPAMHAEFLDAVVGVKASVMVSGYASDQYDTALAGWHRTTITADTGQGSSWKAHQEVVWSTRPFRDDALALFDLSRVGGADAY